MIMVGIMSKVRNNIVAWIIDQRIATRQLERGSAFRTVVSCSDVTRNFTLGGLKPMASAEREAITGVWGQSPQRGPGPPSS